MLVCVTGITGSGKSTAMKIIESQGFNIFIMDEWIHSIYSSREIGYKLIKKHFGNEYINSKEVDRKKLGNLVFSNEKQLNKLNKIMIPLMQKKISSLETKNKLIFVELAIYLNHIDKFKKYFQKVLCITTNKKTEISNLHKKNSHLKKIPTKRVGKLKNPINNKHCKGWYFVENTKNKKYLQKQILFFLKKNILKI